jgi:hypothetical protein
MHKTDCVQVCVYVRARVNARVCTLCERVCVHMACIHVFVPMCAQMHCVHTRACMYTVRV